MDYELIVIGGGSAGHAAARTAASLGVKCALIEAPGPLGGLCILRGCMPSKILIETSNRLREIRDAARFGIQVGEPTLDIETLRARLEELSRDFREHRLQEMADSGYTLLRGSASFVSPHEIRMTDESGTISKLEAKTFIIATGSTPVIPEIDGLADTPYWTSDNVVKLPGIPKRIAIIGSGAIGMESAHLFQGLGSHVTVILRGDRILSAHDPDISAALEAESIHHGIAFLKAHEMESVHHRDGKFRLRFKYSDEPLEIDALLIAAGRTPKTAMLELDHAGVATTQGLILTDDRCATSAPNIFAAGDCASEFPVVHLAVIQGEVAAKNAERILRGQTGHFCEWNHETAMVGLFTDPQCVEIGISEKSALERGIPFFTGKVHYNDQGKGMIAGSRHGFVKLTIHADSRKLIGAAGVGPVVLETAHVVQLAIERELTLEEYVSIPHYHPTLAEAWSSAATHAAERSPIS